MAKNATKEGHVILRKADETRLRKYLIDHGIEFETSGYFDNGTYFAIWGMAEDEFEKLGKFVEEEL